MLSVSAPASSSVGPLGAGEQGRMGGSQASASESSVSTRGHWPGKPRDQELPLLPVSEWKGSAGWAAAGRAQHPWWQTHSMRRQGLVTRTVRVAAGSRACILERPGWLKWIILGSVDGLAETQCLPGGDLSGHLASSSSVQPPGPRAQSWATGQGVLSPRVQPSPNPGTASAACTCRTLWSGGSWTLRMP